MSEINVLPFTNRKVDRALRWKENIRKPALCFVCTEKTNAQLIGTKKDGISLLATALLNNGEVVIVDACYEPSFKHQTCLEMLKDQPM